VVGWLEKGADGVALWLANASDFFPILNRAAKRANVFSGRNPV
jgi:hypothetical protein